MSSTRHSAGQPVPAPATTQGLKSALFSKSTSFTALVDELSARLQENENAAEYPSAESDYFSYYFQNDAGTDAKTNEAAKGPLDDEEWRVHAELSKYSNKSLEEWEKAGEELTEKFGKFMLKLVAFRRYDYEASTLLNKTIC